MYQTHNLRKDQVPDMQRGTGAVTLDLLVSDGRLDEVRQLAVDDAQGSTWVGGCQGCTLHLFAPKSLEYSTDAATQRRTEGNIDRANAVEEGQMTERAKFRQMLLANGKLVGSCSTRQEVTLRWLQAMARLDEDVGLRRLEVTAEEDARVVARQRHRDGCQSGDIGACLKESFHSIKLVLASRDQSLVDTANHAAVSLGLVTDLSLGIH
ncbi:MAG: hypothetical protein FRX49_06924 [Trebouxia sp. A1-2]|nr:MAG: hypothetical protein FRX49_06924 [Trebouxia sp. A1-2]